MIEDFAHRLPLNQIRDGERIDLAADEAERSRIAERLRLPSLDCLQAHATLERTGEIVRARGRDWFAVVVPVDSRLDVVDTSLVSVRNGGTCSGRDAEVSMRPLIHQ